MEDNAKEIIFDPKMFIHSPYAKCPKCGAENQCGVLMVFDRHYIRKCKKCMQSYRVELPKLEKKIIYLDQYVISEMMKSIDARHKSHDKVDKKWKDVFCLLDKLCKYQLIICPDSEIHLEESLVCPYYQNIRRMYQHLSHGIGFKDFDYIKIHQIIEDYLFWLNRKTGQPPKLDPKDVINDDYNGWQDRYIISLNIPDKKEWVDEMKTARDKTHEGFKEIFNRWKREKKSYDEIVKEESESYKSLILSIYTNYYKKIRDAYAGKVQLAANDLYPPFPVRLIDSMEENTKSQGIKDIPKKILEYLNSESLRVVPFNIIASMIYASIARQAINGRKNLPSRGIFNDIQVLSILLPYCDALFIDKECHTYLSDNPLASEIKKYRAKIFSLNNIDEFIQYLDAIESGMSAEHKAKLVEVYGEDWGVPYTEMYKE